MKVAIGRSGFVILTSSVVAYTSFKLLQWRARKRARKTVEKLGEIVRNDRPLIDFDDPVIRNRILKTATRRASKWMSLHSVQKRPVISLSKDAKEMVGQVGGISPSKRPILMLNPDYILKPLRTDHRGVREIAFYEAIRSISNSASTSSYALFLERREPKTGLLARAGEIFDTVALAFNILLHDPVVMKSEEALEVLWKRVKLEVEALNRLAKFTAWYYGVMGQNADPLNDQTLYGIGDEAHLLLQNITVNFSKPCVMDIKMGTQTYEPDAPEDKRIREFNKYPQQIEFGMRIVGMRIFEPAHPDADEFGFRFFDKEYGRGKKDLDSLRSAFREYLSATLVSDEENGETKESFRIKVVSNLLVQLRPLRRWFDENTSLRFYASSLLIVYEGDPRRVTEGSCAIKMIDFGRVRRESGGDQGYIKGLKTVKRILEEVLAEDKEGVIVS